MKDNGIDKIFNNLQHYLMGDASEPYSDKVMALAYEPVNVGTLENPDGEGYVKGDCGDAMTVYLKIEEEIITRARFLVDGCGASVACGCAVTELAEGKTPYEATKITVQKVIRYLDGLPASHVHCALISVQALNKALENLKSNFT